MLGEVRVKGSEGSLNVMKRDSYGSNAQARAGTYTPTYRQELSTGP